MYRAGMGAAAPPLPQDVMTDAVALAFKRLDMATWASGVMLVATLLLIFRKKW